MPKAPAYEKLPPQDLDAEKSVLGSLMIDKEAIHRVVDSLNPQNFYSKQNQTVYDAMIALYEKQRPIDILSVTQRLRESKMLEEIGGQSYLAELVNSVPTATHITYYADTIKSKSILRNLIEASYAIGQLGYNEGEEVEKLIDEAEQLIFQISEKSTLGDFALIKEELQKAYGRIEELQNNPGSMHGLATGFSSLDHFLSGLHNGDLIILAARPSVGKTSLALDIARNVAVHQKNVVGLFSLEMPKEQIVERLLASEGNIDLQLMKKGGLEHKGDFDDFARLNEALNALSQSRIFINDMPVASIRQIRAQARRLKAESGLSLIVIDYLQLIEPRNPRDPVVQQITEISRGLKALARELNVPVIALSQLSRAVEQRGGEPQLSDLRDSGSIEQDADIVIFLHRERQQPAATADLAAYTDFEFSGEAPKEEIPQDREVIKVLIRKHRNGPIGTTQLDFLKRYVTFRSRDPYLKGPETIQSL